MNNILIFQGVFYPHVSYEKFINIAKKYLKFINKNTLNKYKNGDNLTFYDDAQIVHALNLSKFDTLNITYQYFSGFSLGIYSALVASGSLTKEMSFKIIKKRAKILEAAVNKEWDIYLIVGIDMNTLELFIQKHKDKVFISTISSPKHATIAVNKIYAQELMIELKKLRAIVLEKYLSNSAWHTQVIYQSKNELNKLYSSIKNSSAKSVVFSQNENEKLLAKSLEIDCYSTVDFRNVINFCIERQLMATLVDETNNLEKIFFTNTRAKNYKVIKCAQ